MLAREEMFEKKRKPSATVSSSEGVVKKSKTEGDVEKVIKESPKPSTKEGDVNGRIKARCQAKYNFRQIQGFGCPCTCEHW